MRYILGRCTSVKVLLRPQTPYIWASHHQIRLWKDARLAFAELTSMSKSSPTGLACMHGSCKLAKLHWGTHAWHHVPDGVLPLCCSLALQGQKGRRHQLCSCRSPDVRAGSVHQLSHGPAHQPLSEPLLVGRLVPAAVSSSDFVPQVGHL